MLRNKLIYILLLLSFVGCNTSFNEVSEFYSYWNDPENGLISSKEVNNFRIDVKYVPINYLVYREVEGKGIGQDSVQKIQKKYKDAHTFFLTITPIGKQEGGDPAYYGVKNMKEYRQRIEDLSFNAGSAITLKQGEKTFSPILSTMENAYNLDYKKTLYIVFERNSQQSNERLDFVFNDRWFDTGINHFAFSRKEIESVPEFKFMTR